MNDREFWLAWYCIWPAYLSGNEHEVFFVFYLGAVGCVILCARTEVSVSSKKDAETFMLKHVSYGRHIFTTIRNLK